jgi:bifunctional DNase/RNase
MTNDLPLLLLEAGSGALLKVVVSDLEEKVFIGTLLVDFGGVVKEIDCRPSDAIAIAVRAEAPIFVADRLSEREDAWMPADTQGDEQDRRARRAPTRRLQAEPRHAASIETHDAHTQPVVSRPFARYVVQRPPMWHATRSRGDTPCARSLGSQSPAASRLLSLVAPGLL